MRSAAAGCLQRHTKAYLPTAYTGTTPTAFTVGSPASGEERAVEVGGAAPLSPLRDSMHTRNVASLELSTLSVVIYTPNLVDRAEAEGVMGKRRQSIGKNLAPRRAP